MGDGQGDRLSPRTGTRVRFVDHRLLRVASLKMARKHRAPSGRAVEALHAQFVAVPIRTVDVLVRPVSRVGARPIRALR
jgi:hypothetical protein